MCRLLTAHLCAGALLCLAPNPAEAARYTDLVFGYSVEYPYLWQVDTKTAPGRVRFTLPGADVWMEVRVRQTLEGETLAQALAALLNSQGAAASPIVSPTFSGPFPRAVWSIRVDGLEAFRIDRADHVTVLCLRDGHVYELAAKGPMALYEPYFEPFFRSFRFQPRLGR